MSNTQGGLSAVELIMMYALAFAVGKAWVDVFSMVTVCIGGGTLTPTIAFVYALVLTFIAVIVGNITGSLSSVFGSNGVDPLEEKG